MSALGASMIFGLMLVRTASSTVLPVPLVARSMAQARLKSREMPGFVGRDEGEDDVADVAAREIVRLEWIARNVDAGFHRGDAVIDDQADRHLAQAHPDHFADADRRVGDPGAKPESEEIKKNNTKDERKDREHRDPDEVK